jgi:SAM-dependent methyltransferase
MGEAAAGRPPAQTSDVEIVSALRSVGFPDEWYALSTPDHFWFRWRLAAALGQVRRVGIPTDAPLRVLEVGGGTGVLRTQLEGATRWTVDVTDLNLAALRAAARGRGRTLYYDVFEDRPAFHEAYDVVVLFDVLEHVEPTGPFVRAVLGHVRKGGHLLVNVPARRALWSAYDVAAGHVRRYDRASLAAEFHGTGLEVLDVRYWGLSLVPLLMARRLALAGGRSAGEIIRTGFRPPGRFSHAVLAALMHAETAVTARPPLGTSLLLAGRRAG